MKKILPVAVLAALAGVNGAQAVHVNPDGLGQVLMYPYYTVEDGQDTLINLVNTTSDYKAVKIRILESMNSKEVLDFNVYLSPEDHWSAAIIPTETGAQIVSNDNTCTVPLAVSKGDKIPFRTFEFDGSGGTQPDYKPGTVPKLDSKDDPILDKNGNETGDIWGVERTREGYVEVIEMGIVTDPTIQGYIKHKSDGVPGDCVKLDGLWDDDVTYTGTVAKPVAPGYWTSNGLGSSAGMSGVTGGLYGYGVLINVIKATDTTYDAVTLDDWAPTVGSGVIHTAPGSLAPSIGQGGFEFDVFDSGGVVSGDAQVGPLEGWDAVSATLMQATVSNDYVLEPAIAAGTDWVLTFPTKRAYVNGPAAPVEPFTNEWDYEKSVACETFDIEYWNREEGTPQNPVDPNDFSPLPPAGEVPTFSFCHEANVLTFNESNVLAASDRTGVNLDLEDGFNNGWARIGFSDYETVEGGGVRVLETEDYDFVGLPVVGFAVQQYLRDDAASATVSNYAGSVVHKGERDISSID